MITDELQRKALIKTHLKIAEDPTTAKMTFLFDTRMHLSYLITCEGWHCKAEAERMVADYIRAEYDGLFLITLNHQQTKTFKTEWLRKRGYKTSNLTLKELDGLVETHFHFNGVWDTN